MEQDFSYKNIQGWFDFEDLYSHIVQTLPNGSKMLEIGCFLGRSTSFLLSEIRDAKKDIKVTVVDNFSAFIDLRETFKIAEGTPFEIFSSNMERQGFEVEVYEGQSEDLHHYFDKNQFDCIFIDALHDYHSVKGDLENYYPKLKSGGIFAGHDYNLQNEGVVRAVDEFCFKNVLVLNIINNCWYLIKV